MKNLIKWALAATIPLFFSFAINSGESRLADEVAGKYTGLLAKDGQLDKSFSLEVVKISEDVVEVTTYDCEKCQSFQAKVWEDNLSAVRVLRLEPMGGVTLRSGMMTPSNGRLSYGVSPIGSDKIEVFSGVKE